MLPFKRVFRRRAIRRVLLPFTFGLMLLGLSAFAAIST